MEKTDAPQDQVQSAKGRSAFQDWPRVLAGSILFLAAMYAVILGALHTHFHIHHDTKHKHKSRRHHVRWTRSFQERRISDSSRRMQKGAAAT